jgi:hypothetical protein
VSRVIYNRACELMHSKNFGSAQRFMQLAINALEIDSTHPQRGIVACGSSLYDLRAGLC